MIGHNNPPPDEHEFRPGDWIALSRKVREHPIVGLGNPVKPDDPRRGAHSRFEAWFDLLCLAQYKAARVNNRGKVLMLDVGQLMGARSFLAARWNWTEKTVRGYLDTLRAEGMISTSQGQQRASTERNRANVITICNYSRYQMMSDAIDAYIRDLKGPARGQQRASKRASDGHKKGQHITEDILAFSDGCDGVTDGQGQQRASTGADDLAEKGHNLTSNNNNKNICAADTAPLADALSREESKFEEFWSLFPKERRRGKGKARELFLRIVRSRRKSGSVTADQLVEAVREGRGIDPSCPPMPETWLNGGRWQDDAPNQTKQTAAKLWWQDPKLLAGATLDRWRKGIREHANGIWRVDKLGPAPGHPQCVVPAQLIAELRLDEIYDSQGMRR